MVKKTWIKALALLTVVVLSGAHIKAMADQTMAESRRLSVLSVTGEEAYVTKGGARELSAVGGMPLGQGSRARTGYDTNLYIQADDDKTIKMDSNSQVDIAKASSKKLKLTLKSGAIFFQVDKPLKADEEMTFEAAQTSMSIRGTSGVFSVQGDQTTLTLFSGQVQMENQTGSPGDQMVSAGQRAIMNGSKGYSDVKSISWQNLSSFELEAALEQGNPQVLSEMGLDDPSQMEAAQQHLQELRLEKQQQEEREREQEKNRQEAGGGPSRMDGEEPSEDGAGDSGDGELETTVPETTVPETTVPETTVPETTVPETTVPETTVPETTVPETTVPETTEPETTAPETSAPETSAPEPSPPETSEPDSYDSSNSAISYSLML